MFSKKKNTGKNTKKKLSKLEIAAIVILVANVIAWLILAGVHLIPNCYGPRTNTNNVEQLCFDDFHLFTESDAIRINTACKNVQKKYGVNVYVATCERRNKYGEAKAKIWGVDFLEAHGLSQNDDLLLIILNASSSNVVYNTSENSYSYNGGSSYHFDLYYYGICSQKVSSLEVQTILYSKAGDDILRGDSKAVDGVCSMVKKYAFAYKFVYPSLVVVAFAIIGAVIGLIVWVKLFINTLRKCKKDYGHIGDEFNSEIICDHNLKLKVKTDTYSHSTTDSHYSPIIDSDSSSSSSGGGSGSSSSSSSSGGGGSGWAGGR